MKTIIFIGWNIGFNKVECTKLLQKEFGYSLTEGKAITDRIVDNQKVEIQIPACRYEEVVVLKSLA